MRARPLTQGLLDLAQRLRIQARLAAGAAGGPQGLAPPLAPRAIPPHDTLAADPETPRDRALGLCGRAKQPRGLLPTNFQSMEIPS
jgi:hypothetical protein